VRPDGGALCQRAGGFDPVSFFFALCEFWVRVSVLVGMLLMGLLLNFLFYRKI
jgi:hypothetical protein